MGKQNNALYAYLSDSRRFADVFNGSLFQGEQILCAEQLQSDTERYIQKGSGEYKERERASVDRQDHANLYSRIVLG